VGTTIIISCQPLPPPKLSTGYPQVFHRLSTGFPQVIHSATSRVIHRLSTSYPQVLHRFSTVQHWHDSCTCWHRAAPVVKLKLAWFLHGLTHGETCGSRKKTQKRLTNVDMCGPKWDPLATTYTTHKHSTSTITMVYVSL